MDENRVCFPHLSQRGTLVSNIAQKSNILIFDCVITLSLLSSHLIALLNQSGTPTQEKDICLVLSDQPKVKSHHVFKSWRRLCSKWNTIKLVEQTVFQQNSTNTFERLSSMNKFSCLWSPSDSIIGLLKMDSGEVSCCTDSFVLGDIFKIFTKVPKNIARCSY